MNKPYDRTIHHTLELAIEEDWNRPDSAAMRGQMELLRRLFARGQGQGGNRNRYIARDGFVGSSFTVMPQTSPDMTLKILSGLGYQDTAGMVTLADGEFAQATDYAGIPGLCDLAPFKPLVLLADANITIAPAVGDELEYRLDLIEVRCARRQGDDDTRWFLNETTGVWELSEPVHKAILWDLDGDVGTVTAPADSTAAISVKRGADVSATPTEPEVTDGYLPLAMIRVGEGVTALDYDAVINLRAPLWMNGHTSGYLAFTTAVAGGGAPTGFASSIPAGVEAYAVAHASDAGVVYVYVLSPAPFVGLVACVASIAGTTVIASAGTWGALGSSDAGAINSSRNAIGATKVPTGALATKFTIISNDPGTAVPITCVLSLGV